jgi:hypothetical protein
VRDSGDGFDRVLENLDLGEVGPWPGPTDHDCDQDQERHYPDESVAPVELFGVLPHALHLLVDLALATGLAAAASDRRAADMAAAMAELTLVDRNSAEAERLLRPPEPQQNQNRDE